MRLKEFRPLHVSVENVVQRGGNPRSFYVGRDMCESIEATPEGVVVRFAAHEASGRLAEAYLITPGGYGIPEDEPAPVKRGKSAKLDEASA